MKYIGRVLSLHLEVSVYGKVIVWLGSESDRTLTHRAKENKITSTMDNIVRTLTGWGGH